MRRRPCARRSSARATARHCSAGQCAASVPHRATAVPCSAAHVSCGRRGVRSALDRRPLPSSRSACGAGRVRRQITRRLTRGRSRRSRLAPMRDMRGCRPSSQVSRPRPRRSGRAEDAAEHGRPSMPRPWCRACSRCSRPLRPRSSARLATSAALDAVTHRSRLQRRPSAPSAVISVHRASRPTDAAIAGRRRHIQAVATRSRRWPRRIRSGRDGRRGGLRSDAQLTAYRRCRGRRPGCRVSLPSRGGDGFWPGPRRTSRSRPPSRRCCAPDY